MGGERMKRGDIVRIERADISDYGIALSEYRYFDCMFCDRSLTVEDAEDAVVVGHTDLIEKAFEEVNRIRRLNK